MSILIINLENIAHNVQGNWRLGGTLKQTARFACRTNVAETKPHKGQSPTVVFRSPSRYCGEAVTGCYTSFLLSFVTFTQLLFTIHSRIYTIPSYSKPQEIVTYSFTIHNPFNNAVGVWFCFPFPYYSFLFTQVSIKDWNLC